MSEAIDRGEATRRASAPAKQAYPMGRGWSRDQLTIKLTPRRKALLADIALGMPSGTTPNDALDRALECAWSPNQEVALLDGRMAALEEALEHVEARVASAASETRGSIDAILACVNQLSDAIRAAIA